MDDRKELEELISTNIVRLIKRKGQLDIIKTEEDRIKISDIAVNRAYNIFDAVLEFIKKHPQDYQELLSGEFEVIGGTHFPLFVILELTLQMSNSTKIVLSSEDMRTFNALIEQAREFKFSDKFNKNWHVNPRLATFTGADVSYDFLKNRRVNHRDNHGEYVDYYFSTIDTFNQLLLGTVVNVPEAEKLRVEDGKRFDYDFSKYPDFICDEIPYVLVKNTKYEWGTWAVEDQKTYRIILFEEQEKKLTQQYERLQGIVQEAERKEIIAKLEKDVFPYYQDQTFREFVLVDTISWDASEESKKMAAGLEWIFNKIHGVCTKAGLPFDEVLKDPKLVRRFFGISYSVTTPAYFYKRELVKALVDAYNSSTGLSKFLFAKTHLETATFEERLLKLSIADLDSTLQKVRTQAFGIRHLTRAMRETA